jgi:hypothetical protein
MKGACDRAADATTDIRIVGIGAGVVFLDVDKAIVYIAAAATTDAIVAGMATGVVFSDVDKALSTSLPPLQLMPESLEWRRVLPFLM